ncbi:hypothetical protein KXV22_001802 [Aspergillus fumigatus]|nr:hypothetical protein KXX14_001037 [Aspergillus fumigatus]KAH1419846.1 hypothetical protein KXX64_001254 [Aspergillus fumigatus]KAH1756730.1 hypothetical protein KXX09_003893 [Aspergillus fumigatus]KAH1918335.1 hypothetical protein KXW47_000537 [Aspergillus fumigatus]KAH2236383.1 hypothetical protein KXW71_005097 [Aspergillus fumigatus]
MSQIVRLLVSQPLHWLLALAATASASSSIDYTQYVNALMGLERPFSCKGYGGGDIFVGGARPFGMVKLGTDTTAANRSIAVLNGGWTPGGNVTAISHYKSQLQNSTQEEKAKSEITSLIGISLMSSDRARSFIGSEIPSWRLTDTVKDAVEQWNKEVLSKTQVPLDRTANMAHVRLLYSSLYFMYPMPSNRTGDNPLWRKVSEWTRSFRTARSTIAHMTQCIVTSASGNRIALKAYHGCSFKETPYGVPGNSDAGAMNSWLVWQMLGLYPLASQPVYRSISPWFPELSMTVNGNQTLGLKRRAPVLSNILQARQSTSSSDNCNCPNSISGGGIAGIVIGSIVGTLLLIWLFRVCSLPGAWGGGEPDHGYSGGGGTEVRSTHRRSRSSPSYVDYVDKPSRSRRYREDIRRPAKVYLN